MKTGQKIHKFKAVCKELEIEPSIESLQDRIRLQKVFYICKKFGTRLGNKYNWYLHGPYSSSLAKIYYNLDLNKRFKEFKHTFENIEEVLTMEEKKALRKAKTFVESIKDDVEKLEYYADMIFIKNDMFFLKEKNREIIEEKLKELKPKLYEKYDFNNAYTEISKFC